MSAELSSYAMVCVMPECTKIPIRGAAAMHESIHSKPVGTAYLIEDCEEPAEWNLPTTIQLFILLDIGESGGRPGRTQFF